MDYSIFKAYDIRGTYPNQINEAAVYKIGLAFVTYLKAKKIVIGRDARQSSDPLFEILTQGIIDAGCDVIDIGQTTTPMVYFASDYLEVDGAISLTASHNPPHYNGLKLNRAHAVPIGENSGMREIQTLVANGNLPKSMKKGNVVQFDVTRPYHAHMKSFADFDGAQFTVCIDTANAMGALDNPIYQTIPELSIHTLYEEIDPTVPNHEANPVNTDTLADLQALVKEKRADIGIALDGDADRVGFIDENGAIVPMDAVTALLSVALLEHNPGASILYDLRSSKAVKEIIEEGGGVAHECRVGHALIKKQMREQFALFAGELSGHYYFKDNSYAEAVPLAVFTMLNLMAKTELPLSELVKATQRYFHSGEINSEVKDKNEVIKRLKTRYSDGEAHELDGLKVSYDDWWFNVRPSNTEPFLRLNLEAESEEVLKEKKAELLEEIRQNTEGQ